MSENSPNLVIELPKAPVITAAVANYKLAREHHESIDREFTPIRINNTLYRNCLVSGVANKDGTEVAIVVQSVFPPLCLIGIVRTGQEWEVRYTRILDPQDLEALDGQYDTIARDVLDQMV